MSALKPRVLNLGPDEVCLTIETPKQNLYAFNFSKAEAKALGEDLLREAEWPEGPARGTFIIHEGHSLLADRYCAGSISWSEFCAKATVYRVFMLDTGGVLQELNKDTGRWFMPGGTTAYDIISEHVVKHSAFILHNIKEN